MDQTIDLILKDEERPNAAMRLIYTAGPLFAERPFESVSTREVAKAAKVNLSAISYHFGSKAGLYRAVLETIVVDLAPIRNLLTVAINDGIKDAKNDPDKLAELMSGFVETLIRGVTSKDNPRWRMKLAIREIQQPSEYADILINGHINIIHDALGRFFSVIRNKPADSPEIRLLTHSVVVTCLQFGLNDAFICKRMGWQCFGSEEIEIIIAQMKDMVCKMVGLSSSDNSSIGGEL